MSWKKQGRLTRAALVVSTAASLSIASLALWTLGPDLDGCNISQRQHSNTFLRVSVGGSLSREIKRNKAALVRQMPFSGDIVLSITVKINSSGTAEIERAKAHMARSPGTEIDVTGKVREIIQFRNMMKFSDSAYNVRETFDIPLHKS